MARYTPEFLAAARHGYEDTDQPMTALAADLGIGITTLQTLVRKHGWTPRSQRMLDSPPALRLLEEARELAASVPTKRAGIIEQETPTPTLPLSGGGSGPVPIHGTVVASPPMTAMPVQADPALSPIERMEALVVKELEAEEAARAEIALRPRSRHDAERCARTLSVLTQTLQTLQRMRANGGGAGNASDYDDMPADMDAFRNELARRIEIFFENRPEEGMDTETAQEKRAGDGSQP